MYQKQFFPLTKHCRYFTRQRNIFSCKESTHKLQRTQSDGLCDNIEEKIVYNSKIKHGRQTEVWRDRIRLADEKYLQFKSEGPQVIALKYLNNNCTDGNMSENSFKEQNIKNEDINFPYDRHINLSLDHSDTLFKNGDTNSNSSNGSKEIISSELHSKSTTKRGRSWMKDYDKYSEVPVKQSCEEDEEEENSLAISLNYGAIDPNEPPSSVPCGGCGAHLHCQDTSIPGYLPKEIFVGLKMEQLQALVCQRCHFLREYNTALSVTVDTKVYPQLLSKIKNQMALVILVVDMTDFPCSIWPGILDIIGPKRPLVVVGNKIDLLQDVEKDWLEWAKEALIKQLPPRANLLHVALVSAKTGYGVEELITALYKQWEYRGDVYLVGCTNVGKSTLFNALLQSDYCRAKAVDLVQRATTAPWPGTTLNLLKFPIARPDDWRLAMRNQRLRLNANELKRVQEERRKTEDPPMLSYITRTFTSGNVDKYSDDYWADPFAMPKMATLRRVKGPGSGLDPSDPTLIQSKWLHDTPGVINSDQIIDLLTTEELMKTLSRLPIMPRTFKLWVGQSLLIAGLGRIDYISGPSTGLEGNIKMTVLAAFNLPVTICSIEDTDKVYGHYLGTEVLAVPCGGPERLKAWPGLQAAPEFILKGDGWMQSCADIVLSSAGWVAVTANINNICTLQAWTPGARGIHVRVPPVLPRAIALKGTKMYRSPAYALVHRFKKHKL